jgi:hypothetical protein
MEVGCLRSLVDIACWTPAIVGCSSSYVLRFHCQTSSMEVDCLSSSVDVDCLTAAAAIFSAGVGYKPKEKVEETEWCFAWFAA